MNSREIFQKIKEIAATSSKIEKQRLVNEAVADSDFRKVLQYTYDPFKTYGVKKIPEFVSDGDNLDFDEKTWGMLNSLGDRSLSGGLASISISQHLARLNQDSAELLTRIIRKDMRAGFSESTINKACKGLIPDFPYMRCSLVKDADFSTWNAFISQEKADGMFANINVYEDGSVDILSRQGSPFPTAAISEFVEDASLTFEPGTQTHGELLVSFNGSILPREKSNGVLNSLLKSGILESGHHLIFLAWDQVPLQFIKTKGSFHVPYANRLSLLNQQITNAARTSIKLIPTKVFKKLEDAYSHYAELLAKGKEGTIVKHPNAIWEDKTSKFQIKLKLEVDVDLEVKAVQDGREGTKNEGKAGALTCQTSDGKLVVDVAVKNEEMRSRIDSDRSDFIGRIITVRANSIMKPSNDSGFHSLFLPRMVEADYRRDKTNADSLQQVIDQFDSAVSGKAA